MRHSYSDPPVLVDVPGRVAGGIRPRPALVVGAA